MKYGVDTSVVLRILTGMPEPLAAAVRSRVETMWLEGVVLDVCDLVVSETYFALQHSYGLSKGKALDALMKLAVHPGFRLSSQAVAALNVPNLATARPGFLDRVIHGTYVIDNESVMLTCEKDAGRLVGVEVIKRPSPLSRILNEGCGRSVVDRLEWWMCRRFRPRIPAMTRSSLEAFASSVARR